MCPWCHSPQSWDVSSPLLFFEGRCTLCGACADICPENVHQIVNGKHHIDRTLCKRCKACIKVCPVSYRGKWNTGALGFAGSSIDVNALFHLLKPQLDLLKGIGGLTISGGEPLLQFEALTNFLKLCVSRGIHTAIETSASLPKKNVEPLVDLVDRWLVGLRPVFLKNIINRSVTGWEQVAGNLEMLSVKHPDRISIRFPVIPGYTNRRECYQKIKEIMEANKISSIEILPYNPYSNHYYKAMGRSYPLDGVTSISKPELDIVRNFFSSHGFDAMIVR